MIPLKPLRFVAPPCDPPLSLEAFVAARVEDVSLHVIRGWIRDGSVLVDGEKAKATRWLRPDQVIEVFVPPPAPHEAQPEDLPLPIRYEDDHLVVVSKPAGMATHPGPGWWKGSCVNALLFAIRDWPGIGGVAGPGIVHRLDRDTSGLLVFAKSKAAHQSLLKAVGERQFEREYLAWVEGRLEGGGTLTFPLARDPAEPSRVAVLESGKAAITHYESLQSDDARSLVRLRLETGRTHQIRVHLQHIGHPIWGDEVYGTPRGGMALHAARLAFSHPITGDRLEFVDDLPDTWLALRSPETP